MAHCDLFELCYLSSKISQCCTNSGPFFTCVVNEDITLKTIANPECVGFIYVNSGFSSISSCLSCDYEHNCYTFLNGGCDCCNYQNTFTLTNLTSHYWGSLKYIPFE